MAQNFLYMFEFVVDDLLITRPNHCAPEEYPTCCEISFRSSVFVSICDREFGQCVDMCAPKCGKLCIFSLESPVTDKDRLLIHIYKKKTDKCKFLVGATDIPIKPLFDKVTESFNIENPNWMEQLAKHTARLPDPKTPSKTTVVDNDCDDETLGRREQMCPSSEITKRLLPLFNMKHMQTGNLVLIMRLVCNGPTIVNSFPFSSICSTGCGKKSTPCPPICPPAAAPQPQGVCPMPDPCQKPDNKPPICRRYFACNADKGCPCEECEDYCDRECPVGCKKKKKRAPQNNCCPPPPPRCCPQPDPCQNKEQRTDMCQRYFSNEPKGCACEECMDECEAGSSDEESDPCHQCGPPQIMAPCFVTPTKPEPGPEAYEEFEACLNGSGLVIRVLKNTHQVESVDDGMQHGDNESGSDCEKKKSKENNTNNRCETINEILQRSNFAKNHVKRRTNGNIINGPRLPKIRANIKYSGNDTCELENYCLPFNKIKSICNADQKLELYRRKGSCGDDGCGPIGPPLPVQNMRNCCLQVNPQEIKDTLKGINEDTRKKGIEVCYKTCEDTESDVFLVKLGSKQHHRRKQNSIEIELKTPKQPIILPKQKMTTETQITDKELDEALAALCGGKKKGKKGKKGKKK
ncbi:uncharacterized protein LOC129241332 [Anastrepha obliqua]|uniref:uncharacterized protein LOC129241332 n=1 Tax=Anastrepha obliqua TaxID=95512 RepID=UPI00240A83C1|nr:uncharacterized protein LOC129241332 [Anastrepha obliqua]